MGRKTVKHLFSLITMAILFLASSCNIQPILPDDNDGDDDSVDTDSDTDADSDSDSDVLSFPIRSAFYYPWFPETWQTTCDGNTVKVKYQVDLGYYDCDDQAVVDAHIQALDYAKIEVGILSWWGPNTHDEDTRLPLLIERTKALNSNIKWAIYYEKAGFPDKKDIRLETMVTDLKYLKENYVRPETFAHVNGKPVIFVYNKNLKSQASCDITDRFLEATKGQWYVVPKIFGERDECQRQPDTWHQYGPSGANLTNTGMYYSISPGFWKSCETSARLTRDIDRWNQNVRDMISSGEPWQLVTTFNEWGEGTAVESADEWNSASGFGKYLDALHNDGQ